MVSPGSQMGAAGEIADEFPCRLNETRKVTKNTLRMVHQAPDPTFHFLPTGSAVLFFGSRATPKPQCNKPQLPRTPAWPTHCFYININTRRRLHRRHALSKTPPPLWLLSTRQRRRHELGAVAYPQRNGRFGESAYARSRALPMLSMSSPRMASDLANAESNRPGLQCGTIPRQG